jgi:molybdenum cofactor cytidylyltransferase
MTQGPIALALLAAGASRRFGVADKLMAPFLGAPLLARPARRLQGREGVCRLAVVAPGEDARADLLTRSGWQVVENPHATSGQGSSVACATQAAKSMGARALLICLADMPMVSDTTLECLIASIDACDGAMCRGPQGLLPPAIFASQVFERLQVLEGDRGARAVFGRLGRTCEIALCAIQARDVDTPEDLAILEKEAVDA